ncbi:hypothetical protein ACFL6P_10515 [Candidatus Latescibacterota bacterium]
MTLSDFSTLRMNYLVTILLLIFTTSVHPAFAENEYPDAHTEEHEDVHDHHAHPNEIGVSGGYVHLDAHDDSAYGMHLHFIRHLQGDGIKRFIGLGAGVETILADHQHYSVFGAFAIKPYRSLVITLSPGVLFVEHHDEMESRYTSHVEAAYGFFLGEYEFGPVIGLSRSGDSNHYMIGFHLGKGL